jgi:hypothetical protein
MTKQVETDSWNNEQVHGGNVRRVVTQERSPSLAGRRPSFDHVLGDARLRDLKPELEQFAVDARRSPKWVLNKQHFPLTAQNTPARMPPHVTPGQQEPGRRYESALWLFRCPASSQILHAGRARP